MFKKLIAITMAAAMTFSLAACGGGGGGAGTPDTAPAQGNGGQEPVTIRVFTNLPDRTAGQGLIEQMLIDSYMAANPHVTIEVEALHDAEFQIMFRAFAAGTEMPDFVSGWGQPAFLDEVIDAGLLAELNPADWADLGFIEGTKAGFGKDGRLYGLPRNTDVMGFFYNQSVFDEHGWTIPQTFDELVALSQDIRAAGLQPVSVNGGDGWPLGIMLTGIFGKVYGPGVMERKISFVESGDWNDPDFIRAATIFQDAALAGMFANGFETSDYGTAQSLFITGQAAMYYMGSWEAGMATNMDLPEDFRENLRVFMMPVVEGGRGTARDISAWNGGGYFVTANSPVRDEALDLLAYFFRSDNWNRLTWEHGVTMSAQDFTAYMTGNETPVQLQFIDFFMDAASVHGTPMIDLGSSDFKIRSERLLVDLAIGTITPEQFAEELSAAS
jgi:raffinose/stachyose/melibiose transport system substrate-binding protein